MTIVTKLALSGEGGSIPLIIWRGWGILAAVIGLVALIAMELVISVVT
jgi:hypothetical protein